VVAPASANADGTAPANKTFGRFFDYFHEDYGANEAFDEYNTELLRGADTLILSGRTSFRAIRTIGCPIRTPPVPRSGASSRRSFGAQDDRRAGWFTRDKMGAVRRPDNRDAS
jgi:hypothetical protein